MEKNIVFKWAISLLFIMFAVILIFQIGLVLSGHSPTDIQILYVGFGTIISYLLLMSFKLGTFVGEVGEFMKTTKNSFAKLKEENKK
tara:strand:+ start:348 stop:608 length:261 start_codon:yes stop_codon:yes gene_type:complete